eukprot:scaffold746_cov112-Isochrysis_galbana.AAC.5
MQTRHGPRELRQPLPEPNVLPLQPLLHTRLPRAPHRYPGVGRPSPAPKCRELCLHALHRTRRLRHTRFPLLLPRRLPILSLPHPLLLPRYRHFPLTAQHSAALGQRAQPRNLARREIGRRRGTPHRFRMPAFPRLSLRNRPLSLALRPPQDLRRRGLTRLRHRRRLGRCRQEGLQLPAAALGRTCDGGRGGEARGLELQSWRALASFQAGAVARAARGWRRPGLRGRGEQSWLAPRQSRHRAAQSPPRAPGYGLAAPPPAPWPPPPPHRPRRAGPCPPPKPAAAAPVPPQTKPTVQ